MAAIVTMPGAGPKRIAKSTPPHKMAAGARHARQSEIDHLGGKDKRAHHAHQWQPVVGRLPVGATRGNGHATTAMASVTRQPARSATRWPCASQAVA